MYRSSKSFALLIVAFLTSCTAGFSQLNAWYESAVRLRNKKGGTSLSPNHTSMNLFRAAARAGIQSASIMTVADITTQLVVEKRTFVVDKNSKVSNYDPLRTLRWATVGLALHGPFFFLSFGKIDRMFGAATNLLIVAKKTTFAQFVVFPPYLCALFAALGLMEGRNDVLGGVRERVPKAFVSGCVFWPLANFAGFSFVPPNVRIIYLAAVGSLWNGYLSYMNAKK